MFLERKGLVPEIPSPFKFQQLSCCTTYVLLLETDGHYPHLPNKGFGYAGKTNNLSIFVHHGILFCSIFPIHNFNSISRRMWPRSVPARHIGEKEGLMLEAETGDFLGSHTGFWFYTIGQHQGLRLPGGPWYVVEKDVAYNVVFVSRNYFSADKRRRMFRVGSLRWLYGSPPNQITPI